MATYYSQSSGVASTVARWNDAANGSGSAPASIADMDDDLIVIQAGHVIDWDVDTSGWANGFQTFTIEGHATTPGTLRCDSTTLSAGTYWIKIKTGYHIVGTSGDAKGRILANANGTWGATGSLALDRLFIIDLQGTATVNAQYLDIALYCTQPTNLWVRSYETKYDFTANTDVSTANDTIDLGTTPPSEDTPVMVTTASGTLPTPLEEDVVYYVRAVSGNTCKLASWSGSDSLIIDITATGSGTCSLITGHSSTSTKVINILEDLTADTAWSTTAGQNRVVFVDSSAPAAYDQQRDTLAAIDTATPFGVTITTNNVAAAKYPGAKIFLASRNVAIRSNGTTTAQAIVNYTSATTASGVFQCEITNTYQPGTQTTFYGYGINNGTGHTVSGVISGCNNGINYGTGHTVSGVISGCNNGIYYGTGNTVSGVISGCNNGFNSGVGHTVSGVISGCNYGINYGTGHTVSGVISGCNNGINYGTGHTVSGVISGCNTGFASGTGHTVSGVISGCGTGFASGTGHTVSGKIGYTAAGDIKANLYDFAFGNQYGTPLSVVLKNATIPATPSFSGRNTAGSGSQGKQGVYSEDHGNVLGASKCYQPMGDVIKTAINSGGDAPTQNPGGAASGDCIEVSNVQSNCSTIAPITVFENHRLWLEAGTYTITYSVQTTYSGISEGNLKLFCRYISEDDPLTYTETTHAPAISERSGATDWSQTLYCEITTAAEGWVECKMHLMEYQAGDEVYVWPTPVVS